MGAAARVCGGRLGKSRAGGNPSVVGAAAYHAEETLRQYRRGKTKNNKAGQNRKEPDFGFVLEETCF